MRTLIIDDEESARARLARLLTAHPEIDLIGEARDGIEAVTRIEQLKPDLIFLDIEIPGLTGFEVLQALSPATPLPLVIFVTGYDQHALAAFDANALAYLLKPVEPERLAQSLDRARKLTLADRRHVQRVVHDAPRQLRQIVCRKRDRVVLLAPAQILWFQVEDGIVKAHTAAETYWVNYQLAELEAGLPDGLFFRSRREVLVNLSGIKEIRPYFKSSFLLVMADATATELAVSERQARAFRLRVPGL